jgi:hypothetical protein
LLDTRSNRSTMIFLDFMTSILFSDSQSVVPLRLKEMKHY